MEVGVSTEETRSLSSFWLILNDEHEFDKHLHLLGMFTRVKYTVTVYFFKLSQILQKSLEDWAVINFSWPPHVGICCYSDKCLQSNIDNYQGYSARVHW